MHEVRRCAYTVKSFIYAGSGIHEKRWRPRSVVALLYKNEGCVSNNLRGASRGNRKSLATLGLTGGSDDDRINDYFLPLYDHGHLLGSQYGGSNDSYNLVPMLRNINRGGVWAEFETSIARLGQPSLVAIRCHYSTKKDPRMPVRIEAALLPIDIDSAKYLDSNWSNVLPALREIVNAHDTTRKMYMSLVHMLKIGWEIDERKVKHVEVKQEPFILMEPFYKLSNPGRFFQQLAEAYDAVAYDWRVEDDKNATVVQFASEEALRNGDFVTDYRLPPPEYRPYAVLDYMALRGQLTEALADINFRLNFTNGKGLHEAGFSRGMRSLAMHVNLYVKGRLMQGQRAYLSDAWRFEGGSDDGTLGQGLVLVPEFDHIIPRVPEDGGKPGPTIFSNLQITSPGYNNRKRNNILVSNTVSVGRHHKAIATRMHHQRGQFENPVATENLEKNKRLHI